MAHELRPALEPEMWEDFAKANYSLEQFEPQLASDFDSPSAQHFAAALLLHGQPFGFSREDLLRLASVALDEEQLAILAPDTADESRELARWLHDLAARIGALLPPANGG